MFLIFKSAAKYVYDKMKAEGYPDSREETESPWNFLGPKFEVPSYVTYQLWNTELNK